MNDRLEIASRLKMANASLGVWIDNEAAVQEADALIAEEARTRPPAADAPDDLRAVAEEMCAALMFMRVALLGHWQEYDAHVTRLGWTEEKGDSLDWGVKYLEAIIARARALGLGGTGGGK